jgi:hypothetical protein
LALALEIAREGIWHGALQIPSLGFSKDLARTKSKKTLSLPPREEMIGIDRGA